MGTSRFTPSNVAKLLGLALLMTLLAVPAAFGAPGDLDPSFGQGGRVILQINTACLQDGCQEFMGSYAGALALQPNGGMVLGGWEIPRPGPGNPRAALLRLSANGALDPSFGSGGQIERAPLRISHVYPLSSGGLLVLGGAEDGRVGIQRYTAAGVLDGSFSTEAVRWLAAPGQAVDEMLDIAGRIVVLAKVSEKEILVVRFLASGKRDTSFGSDGIARLPTMPKVKPIGLATEWDGSVIVAGAIDTSIQQATSATRLFLARLTPNGTLDASFGKRGVVRVPIAYPGASGVVAVAPNRHIFLATSDGRATLPSRDQDFTLVDYTNVGLLDHSFGKDGISQTALPLPRVGGRGASINPNAIAFDGAGDTIVAGERHNFTTDTRAGIGFLARYTPTGRDCSFGTHGIVLSGEEPSGANAVAVQPNGRIVLAGWSHKAFLAARYVGGGTPRTCPGELGNAKKNRNMG